MNLLHEIKALLIALSLCCTTPLWVADAAPASKTKPVKALAHTSFSAEWQPVAGSMLTEWGENISPDNAWTEYPRPQMVRKNWTNLNGMWEYSITRQSDKRAGGWDGEILVPFAIEAPLSGVGRSLEPYEALWYRRGFNLQQNPRDGCCCISRRSITNPRCG